MTGFMNTVLNTELGPYHPSFNLIPLLLKPPLSHVKGKKKRKDGNERNINEWRKKNRIDFPFNFYAPVKVNRLFLVDRAGISVTGILKI